jgi:nucleotide-binding universal stress UspA family protein
MSATWFLFGMFVTFAAIGIASAVVMGRRGYAPFSWGVIGSVLGPLVVPLALARSRQARQLPRASVGSTWQGPVDVLVGIDGSSESIAAMTVIARLLGERVGRFTLATVVDYDTDLGGRTGSAHQAARAHLDQAAAAVPGTLSYLPEMVVLSGPPADALAERAGEGHFDILAVGSRGRGASTALLGSVATRLARGARTPILIVSDDEATRVTNRDATANATTERSALSGTFTRAQGG